MCLGGGSVKIPPPVAPPVLPTIETAPQEGVAAKKRKARLGKRSLRKDLGGTGIGTGLGIPNSQIQ